MIYSTHSARKPGKEFAIFTFLASVLIHIAEHTQRYVGQAITTAKIVRVGSLSVHSAS